MAGADFGPSQGKAGVCRKPLCPRSSYVASLETQSLPSLCDRSTINLFIYGEDCSIKEKLVWACKVMLLSEAVSLLEMEKGPTQDCEAAAHCGCGVS